MRTALITGAAGGIGQALVAAFAGADYRVIGLDCVDQPTHLHMTHYQKVDLERFVEDEAYALAVTSGIESQLGDHGLHALVNNAALQICGGVDSLSRTAWKRSLDVNLVAPFLLTQALLHQLERVSGCVVNISSIHARQTKKNFVAYATTKAALSGLTRAMAVDLGPKVRVNAIEPAAIATCMLKAGFNDSPEKLRDLETYHPLGRIGTPQEVAVVALALAGDSFGFMQGESIALDGGIGVRLHDPE